MTWKGWQRNDLKKWNKMRDEMGHDSEYLDIPVKLSRSFLHKLSSLFQLQKKLQKA